MLSSKIIGRIGHDVPEEPRVTTERPRHLAFTICHVLRTDRYRIVIYDSWFPIFGGFSDVYKGTIHQRTVRVKAIWFFNQT